MPDKLDSTTTIEVRYQITVTRTQVEVTLARAHHGVIGESEKPRGDSVGGGTYLASEYGRVPEVLGREEVEREIYSQSVPEIDLAALVSVVNGLAQGRS